MSNFLQPSMGGHGDHNEQQYVQEAEKAMRQLYTETEDTAVDQDQAHIEGLMASGFAWDEAIKLVGMREHVYENSEMRQRMENNPRMQFVRWLIENGELDEQ